MEGKPKVGELWLVQSCTMSWTFQIMSVAVQDGETFYVAAKPNRDGPFALVFNEKGREIMDLFPDERLFLVRKSRSKRVLFATPQCTT